MYISLGIGAAVILVIALVLVLTLGVSSKSNEPAGNAVQGYLDALARGDAAAALSYSGDQPASKDLLTDEILSKQIKKWPITDIRILGDDSKNSPIPFAMVHVAVKFGSTTSDVNMTVKKNGDGQWKLDAAAIKLDPSPGGATNAAAATMTVFGKTVSGPTYVFPGFLGIGSSNPYVNIAMDKPLLLDALSSYGSSFLQATYTLNSAGTRAITEAVATAFASCERSDKLSPPAPCPVSLRDRDLIDGTAVWGVADLSKLQVASFSQYDLDARISGEVVVQVSTQDTTGGRRIGRLTTFVSAEADLTSKPPKITFN